MYDDCLATAVSSRLSGRQWPPDTYDPATDVVGSDELHCHCLTPSSWSNFQRLKRLQFCGQSLIFWYESIMTTYPQRLSAGFQDGNGLLMPVIAMNKRTALSFG